MNTNIHANKIAIIYASVHHGNTKKLVQEIGKQLSIDCYSVEEAKNHDLSSYDAIGIASGLYFGKLHQSILDYLDSSPKVQKEAFALITCGDGGKKHISETEDVLKKYGFHSNGAFVCKGFDTYGPFKLIGGINKHHPNEADVNNAIEFIKKSLINV